MSDIPVNINMSPEEKKNQLIAMRHFAASDKCEELTGLAPTDTKKLEALFQNMYVKTGEAWEHMYEFLDEDCPPEGYDMTDEHDYKNWANWMANELSYDEQIYEFTTLCGRTFTILDFRLTVDSFWKDENRKSKGDKK